MSITFLTIADSKAQEIISTPEINSLTKLRLTAFGIGLEREQKIGLANSIYYGANLASVFLFDPVYKKVGRAPDIVTIEGSIGIAPVIYFGYRNYTNLSKRLLAGNEIRNNSGAYVGFHLSGSLPLFQKNYTTKFAFAFGPQIGFQRSLSKKLNFEIGLGPAIKTNFETTKIVPFNKLGLSLLL